MNHYLHRIFAMIEQRHLESALPEYQFAMYLDWLKQSPEYKEQIRQSVKGQ